MSGITAYLPGGLSTCGRVESGQCWNHADVGLDVAVAIGKSTSLHLFPVCKMGTVRPISGYGEN